MDKNLFWVKVFFAVYILLAIGLSATNHFGGVVVMTLATYSWLGYRKWKRYQAKKMANGVVL